MNRKGEQGMFFVIITVFVALLFGLSLLPSIANTSSLVTDRQTFTNDSITYAGTNGSGQIDFLYQMNLTKYQTDWRSSDSQCFISITGITNNNGTAYTTPADYNFTSAYGNFTLGNNFKTNWTVLNGNNKTLVNYTYCDTGYATDSASRAGMDLIQTLLIVVLIVAGAAAIKNKFE